MIASIFEAWIGSRTHPRISKRHSAFAPYPRRAV